MSNNVEILGQLPGSGESPLSTFSSPSTGVYHASSEEQSFRYTMTLTPGATGDIIGFVPLDHTVSPNFLRGYEFFTYRDLKLEVQCVGAFGTASGSMMATYFADPLNLTTYQDPQSNLDKFIQTEGTIYIRPKDNKIISVPVGEADPIQGTWRYVNETGNIRQSSFGGVYFITDQPSAAGDGTRWTLVVSGYAIGRRRTIIGGGAVQESHTYIDYTRVSEGPTVAWDASLDTHVINIVVPNSINGEKIWAPARPGEDLISYVFELPITFKGIQIQDQDKEITDVDLTFQAGSRATMSGMGYGGILKIKAMLPPKWDSANTLTVLGQDTWLDTFWKAHNGLQITALTRGTSSPSGFKAAKSPVNIVPTAVLSARAGLSSCAVMGSHRRS